MAASHTLAVDTCTTTLPNSSSFIGQSGSGNTSANFSRLPIKGGGHFQGRIGSGPTYSDEGSLGFN